MTGAHPNTSWLNGCIALDDKGFIKTGLDLSTENLNARGWPLTRQPYLLETSLPGIFSVGDYVAAASSVLHLRWEKDQLQYHLSIKYCRNRKQNKITGLPLQNIEAFVECMMLL
jgi:hypothetical protein